MEACVWSADVHSIKGRAAAISEKYQNREDPALFVAFQGWIRQFNDFVTKWGATRVPPDVIRAKDDVVENLKARGYTIPTEGRRKQSLAKLTATNAETKQKQLF